MSSTTATNSTIAPTQPTQSSFSAVKSGSTSPLASLANATEPSGSTTKQQQSPVGTFPQRISGGSPTASTGSPFNFSLALNSTSGPNPPFSFTNASTSDSHPSESVPNPTANIPSSFSFANPPATNNPARFSFTNASAANNSSSFSFTNSLLANNPPSFHPANPTSENSPPRFSFTSLPPKGTSPSTANPASENSPPRFSFTSLPPKDTSPSTANQSTVNPQTRQPISTLTFTSSARKQAASNNATSASNVEENLRQMALSQQLSDPLTPTSQQASLPNLEQEIPEAPSSLAEQHLLSKNINTELRDSQNMVVDRSDKDSPLFSLRSFQELNLKPDLLKGIYQMNFSTPSKIQEITLPLLMNNPPRNIIAQSQSGTGKTAAFSLALLSRIDPSIRTTQALIVSPTFELALQIGSVIERMAQYLPYIQLAYAVRESAGSSRINLVRNQLITHPIVIGTPGTIEDWCRVKRVIDLKKLTMFVVDEADVMIDLGDFKRMCVNLVKDLNHPNCQLMLFSATYSDRVMEFARQIVPNPVVLRLKREKQALNNIRQFFIRCHDLEMKYQAIEQIYTQLTVGQTMIFCRKKRTAYDLSTRMSDDNHAVRLLSSDLVIEQRAAVIDQFRKGLFRVLVSTNVTARGIDIDDVSLVINYDMPVTMEHEPDYETYLHRIGRCGRFGKLGYAFNLVGSEKDLNTMNAIQENFSHPIEEITIEQISGIHQNDE